MPPPSRPSPSSVLLFSHYCSVITIIIMRLSCSPFDPHRTARQLRLICCTFAEIMPFCMEIIIRTLKDVAFCDAKNERALGQLLVLLQYQWPKQEEIFASLITTMQKRRKYFFPEFFQYNVSLTQHVYTYYV